MGRTARGAARGGAADRPASEGGRDRSGDHPVARESPSTVVAAPVVKLVFAQLPGNTTSGDPNGPVGQAEFWVVEGGTRRPARGQPLPHTYADGSLEVRPQTGQEVHLLGTTYRLAPIASLSAHTTDGGAQQRLVALGYGGLHPDDHLLEVLRFQLDHGKKPTGMLRQHRPGEDDASTYGDLDDALRQLVTRFPITSG